MRVVVVNLDKERSIRVRGMSVAKQKMTCVSVALMRVSDGTLNGGRCRCTGVRMCGKPQNLDCSDGNQGAREGYL